MLLAAGDATIVGDEYEFNPAGPVQLYDPAPFAATVALPPGHTVINDDERETAGFGTTENDVVAVSAQNPVLPISVPVPIGDVLPVATLEKTLNTCADIATGIA